MKAIQKFFIGLFLTIIVVISLVPFIWVLFSSFKTNSEILSAGMGFPTGMHISNYVTAFKLAPILTFYKNSIVVAIVATVLNLFVCSMAAYVVVRCNFKAKGLVTLMFSLGLIIPGAALIQPLYTILNGSHLYNSLTGLVLVYTALGMPPTF